MPFISLNKLSIVAGGKSFTTIRWFLQSVSERRLIEINKCFEINREHAHVNSELIEKYVKG